MPKTSEVPVLIVGGGVAGLSAAWRLVRAGRPVPGGHAANFDRGIL